jgi:hypothetical protein
MMDVAVVYRRSYFDLLGAAITSDSDIQRFVQEELPKYQSSDKLPPSLRKKY